MTYEQRLGTLREALAAASASIEEDACELALTEGERKHYAENERLHIHDELFELFSQVNGLAFRWRHSDAARNLDLAGFFMFQDFISLMENQTENQLWVDWYEEGDITEMKRHRILERIHGNDAYITLKLKEDGGYSLHFVDGDRINHGGSQKLPVIPLTLKQYFEVITGYFGVHSVRYHLHKEDFYTHPEKYVPEFEGLKALFPDFKPPAINPFQV